MSTFLWPNAVWRLVIVALASIGMLVWASSSVARPGDVQQTLVLRGDRSVGNAEVVRGMSDGRTIVAGSSEGLITVRVLTPAGKIDHGFADDGALAVSEPGKTLRLRAAAIGPDDGITLAVGGDVSRVYRFTSDGAPDNAFAGDGIYDAAPSIIVDLGVDEENRPLFASPRAVKRLTTAGVPDVTFGGGGSVAFAPNFDPDHDPVAVNVAALSGGGVVIAGDYNSGGEPGLTSVFQELDVNGDPIEGFGSYADGVAKGRGQGGTAGIAVGSDGSVVFINSGIFRLTPEGSIDDGFSSRAVHPAASLNELAIDAEGRVLFRFNAGRPDPMFAPTNGLGRLLPSGRPDPEFGTGGATYVYGKRGLGRQSADMWVGSGDVLLLSAGNLTSVSTGVGGANADGDAFGDRRDRCARLPSNGRQGCPAIDPGEVRMAEIDRVLAGDIDGTVPACIAKVDVTVVRKTARGSRRVAKVETNNHGGWTTEVRDPSGRYRASIPARDRGRFGHCEQSRSAFVAF